MRKFSIMATLALVLLLPAVTYSEFIINDKDGWTNIRKKPDAKSEVVGKVLKHQVFRETIFCGDDPPAGNWQAVTVDFDYYNSIDGYIFKNNITSISSFPEIGGGDSGERNEKTIVTAKKDDITVTMKIVPKPGYPGRGAEEIIIMNGGKNIVISPNIPDARGFSLFIGNDGALYLQILNSSDGEPAAGWYSIVNGRVVFSTSWAVGCK